MKSMIKRKVEIAYTPHVETVHRIILDGLEVSRSMFENLPVDCPSDHLMALRHNAFFYRFMRRTGHTTALRSLFSHNSNNPFKDVQILPIFQNPGLASDFNKSRSTPECVAASLGHILSGESNFLRGTGRAYEMLIFADFINIGGSPSIDNEVWQCVEQIVGVHNQPVKFVVFLG